LQTIWAQVLVLVIGEHHDIIAYYNCDSESEEQLKPAFMALRARLERLGKLQELQFWPGPGHGSLL
jgi:hypothetical protein